MKTFNADQYKADLKASRRKRCTECGYAGFFTHKTKCWLSKLGRVNKDENPGKCNGDLVEIEDGRCSKAALGHGPGHQSKTVCDMVAADHQYHHCTYGEFRQEAWWEGDGLSFSGYFDEPPEVA